MCDKRGQHSDNICTSILSHVKDGSFDIVEISAKTDATHLWSPGEETGAQLRSARLSGNVCHLDISSAECRTATVENLRVWRSTSVHSRPRSTLPYLKLPDCMLYLCTVHSSSSFRQLSKMGWLRPDISVSLMSGCLTACEAHIKGTAL